MTPEREAQIRAYYHVRGRGGIDESVVRDLLAALDEARGECEALRVTLDAALDDVDAEREACAAYLRETAAGLMLAATDCATSAERRQTLCAADELVRAADAIRARGSLNP